MYDDFEKLVNNTRIPSLCKQEVICWDKIEQKNGVSNKEDPEMKKTNFTNVGKNYEERINTFISLSLMLKKVKFFVIIQEWLKG